MNPKLSRRRAIAGLSSSLLLPLGQRTHSQPTSSAAAFFRHGVASGDPGEESVVIWTRVSGFNRPVQVDWQIAEDPEFRLIMSRGTVTAKVNHDYTVKVLVDGLSPGKTYHYRFHIAQGDSPAGRTRTLPRGKLDNLTLAVVSCSNYPFGHFNGYEAIARDPDIDWVLHLGDYIYEYGVEGYGGKAGELLGRDHEPSWETVTLADYRARHAQYKSDPQSQLMHAVHPLLAIWDDHEVANNPWLKGAQNHQPGKEGAWEARREAALQAYFEWMPIRNPFPGQRRADYWRHWNFGDLASLVSLETRHSGRAKQIEYSDYAGKLETPAQARAFEKDVLGAQDRPMISEGMHGFLGEALVDAKALKHPWKVIANQIPMARTRHPKLAPERLEKLAGSLPERSRQRLRELGRKGQLELPLYLDPWDGYPVAREEFYRLCQSCDTRDLLVLTGDTHSFWNNRLFDDAGQPMGLELGTTAITSPGSFAEFGPDGVALIDEALAASNSEIDWTEGRYNGYLRVRLTHSGGRADYVALETIAERSRKTRTLRSVDIEHYESTLRYSVRS